MAKCEIIAVGTELLLGQLTDTNTPHIARALATNGLDVYGTHAVGDNRARIAAAILDALARADGVITCGGLGPTIDDLTKEAICDALGLDVELNGEVLRGIEQIFAGTGRTMRDNNRKQALLPRGSTVLPNPRGTAAGFIAFSDDGKFVAAMPGVPHEMFAMLDQHLMPWLRERFALNSRITTRVLHTIGIAESEIDHRIADLFASQENPKIAVLAHDFRCDVKLMAKAQDESAGRALIEPLEKTIVSRLNGHIFGADDETLEGVLIKRFGADARTLAVAESCTGGRICARLTTIPGASKVFLGGVVSYDNSVKSDALGVSDELLSKFGAVSDEAVSAMAQGVRERLRSDVGLATTGIAGPDGGTPEKPVGLVWLAIADANGVQSQRLELRGSREIIQSRATVAALGLLWRTFYAR
ncbi:MAG: competence/damage-inducible protein A [Candidatus Eremiobacteraeota bacterium]|nr:competence/damage-inducible protein A [Candidatus Eremiobacteraeota bacterium]